MRAIITYHSLDTSGSPISLSPSAFRTHVDWFASGRVRVVGVQELMALDDGVDAVALTFDDGFANFASEALPPMLARGLPATLFVVTDRAGRDNKWRGVGDVGVPVLPLLDWDALGRLHESGITLGAHTRTHPHLPALSAAALHEELCAAADEMQQRLGERPRGFAYPYGAVDPHVEAATAQCYEWACTTEFRPLAAQEPSMLLPRLDAWYFRDSRFSRWGTPAFRAWVWSRRQGRRARSLLRVLGAS